MADTHLIFSRCSGSVFLMCSRSAWNARPFASCFCLSTLFARLAARALLTSPAGPVTCECNKVMRHAVRKCGVVRLLVSSSSCDGDSDLSRIESASLRTPPEEEDVFGRCFRFGVRSTDGEW